MNLVIDFSHASEFKKNSFITGNKIHAHIKLVNLACENYIRLLL